MYQTTWISNHFGNPQILAQRGTGVSVELRYSSNAQLMTNQTCRTSYLYDLQTQKERQVWARWRERQSHRVYNLTRSQTFTVTTALKYWNILSLRNQIGTMTTSLQFRFESFTFRISAPLEQEVMLNSLIYINFYFIVLLTLCFVTGVEVPSYFILPGSALGFLHEFYPSFHRSLCSWPIRFQWCEV